MIVILNVGLIISGIIIGIYISKKYYETILYNKFYNLGAKTFADEIKLMSVNIYETVLKYEAHIKNLTNQKDVEINTHISDIQVMKSKIQSLEIQLNPKIKAEVKIDVDTILDKINVNGLESLTEEERKILKNKTE